MNRYTNTDKWDEVWFSNLTVNQKLLLLYIKDKCDNAGFYQVNYRKIQFDLQMPKKETLEAFKGIMSAYIGAEGWVMVKEFLKDQKRWPINPKNNAHKQTIFLIEEQRERFKKDEYFNKTYKHLFTEEKPQENTANTSEKQKTKSTKFVPPTVTQILEYFKEKGWDETVAKEEAEKFFNFYDSKNWMVGKNKMSKWKSSASGWKSKAAEKAPTKRVSLTQGAY